MSNDKISFGNKFFVKRILIRGKINLLTTFKDFAKVLLLISNKLKFEDFKSSESGRYRTPPTSHFKI